MPVIVNIALRLVPVGHLLAWPGRRVLRLPADGLLWVPTLDWLRWGYWSGLALGYYLPKLSLPP
jgi:hypothetical protein